ncbi:MAG: pyrroloquinoline quinone biosynthesis peptide chaperone PqqD [Candidatus Sulfotelmatobacter sp.]
MAPPSDTSQPRLAAGCRWGPESSGAGSKTGSEENRVILFPEGAIKLQGTGRQVLERCDGQRTFGEIIAELQKQFSAADPAKIRSDISVFLEQLQKKRIVDY